MFWIGCELSLHAVIDRLDVVILSALEIDTQFNVDVLTSSDGGFAVHLVVTATRCTWWPRRVAFCVSPNVT